MSNGSLVVLTRGPCLALRIFASVSHYIIEFRIYMREEVEKGFRESFLNVLLIKLIHER